MDEQLFSQKQKKEAPAPQSAAQQITSVASRLKLTEERYSNLQKRNQLTEASLLSFEKEIKTELRVLTQQLVDMKQEVSDINSKVDVMVGELSSMAQKHDVAVVEKYLDLWQPMRFLTRKEAERLIDDFKHKVKHA